MTGRRLHHYEILRKLGEGGMGEVWLARDTKLDREVALKVLPEEFASDPERMARFEREARVLASLNHPNIAHLYGLETAEHDDSDQTGDPDEMADNSKLKTKNSKPPSGTVTFLVMEVVEGSTAVIEVGGRHDHENARVMRGRPCH